MIGAHMSSMAWRSRREDSPHDGLEDSFEANDMHVPSQAWNAAK